MVHVPSLFHSIKVDQAVYPVHFKTNEELLQFANGLVRPPRNKAVQVYMCLDIVQSVITFVVCASVMLKKGRVKDTKIISLRQSPYGTFIVPNAIWWMLVPVSFYLLGWAGFCSWILYVQGSSKPLIEWLFYIPFPWLPLALGAFYSTYGFVLACTPRSPISNLASIRQNGSSTKGLSWMHLPLPHSALVMNTFMVGVGVVMIVYNVVVTVLNGKQRQLTHKSGHNVYVEVLLQPHTQEWLHAAPTPELLYIVKVAWCDLGNVYRLCCAALASYMVLIILIVAILVLYAVPNHIFLMDHLVRVYPDPSFEQPETRSAFALLGALWRIGLPKHLHGNSYSAFKKTWMMVMVGHSQIFLILAGLFTFSVPVFYLFFVPWSNGWGGRSSASQITFIIAFCITAALLTAAWITAVSGMLTFDEIYRAVSGLEVTPMDETASRPRSGILRTFREAILPGSRPGTAPQMSPLADAHSPLRTELSFCPSTSSHDAEKSTADHPYRSSKENTIRVVTETSIRVDHVVDVEALRESHGYPPSTPTRPYSFLGRSRSLGTQGNTPPAVGRQLSLLGRKS